jgi:hypothetical protein
MENKDTSDAAQTAQTLSEFDKYCKTLLSEDISKQDAAEWWQVLHMISLTRFLLENSVEQFGNFPNSCVHRA